MPHTTHNSSTLQIGDAQLNLIERLSNACAVSGDEGEVRKIVLSEVTPYADEIKVDSLGNVLGHHSGLASYTVGQRKGLHIAHTEPLYVLEKNINQNTIIVGTREQSGDTQLLAKNVNWIAGHPPTSPFQAQVMIRYKSRDVPGLVSIIDQNTFHIDFFDVIRDITPGQAAVLYNGDNCLGGGIIAGKTFPL